MLDRQYGKIVWTCDGCEDPLETDTRDFAEAQDALREAGWTTDKKGGKWVHYCSSACRNEDRPVRSPYKDD